MKEAKRYLMAYGAAILLAEVLVGLIGVLVTLVLGIDMKPAGYFICGVIITLGACGLFNLLVGVVKDLNDLLDSELKEEP